MELDKFETTTVNSYIARTVFQANPLQEVIEMLAFLNRVSDKTHYRIKAISCVIRKELEFERTVSPVHSEAISIEVDNVHLVTEPIHLIDADGRRDDSERADVLKAIIVQVLIKGFFGNVCGKTDNTIPHVVQDVSKSLSITFDKESSTIISAAVPLVGSESRNHGVWVLL